MVVLKIVIKAILKIDIKFIHHKINPLKLYNSLVFIITTSCTAVTTNSRMFSSSQKDTPYPFAVTPHLPSPHANMPKPRQPLIYLLSPWICLFWIFHINGIVQYVAFCVWFLSFSIMFSRLSCMS